MTIKRNMKSTYEAAKIIGVSVVTINNWIRKGVFYEVVELAGYTGRPQRYIPTEQVCLVKKLREENSAKKTHAGILCKTCGDDAEDATVDNTSSVCVTIEEIQNMMIEAYGELDKLKKSCE